jgi:hypothetical protein
LVVYVVIGDRQPGARIGLGQSLFNLLQARRVKVALLLAGLPLVVAAP